MSNNGTVRVMGGRMLEILQRNAKMGDHNSKVLLALALRGGIPQGNDRLVAPQASK